MSRRPPPPSSALAALGGALVLGVLGLALVGAEPVRQLAWLTLIAPGAGALCGAAGVRLWPWAAAVPGAWTIALVYADASSQRDLPAPHLGACVVAGLFLAGLGLGALVPGRAFTAAGIGWVFTLALALAPIAGAHRGAAGATAASSPWLARTLLDLDPLAWSLESAGWDWTHASPLVYRAGGVEWAPRPPLRGALAAPTALVVGCALAAALPRVRRRLRTSAG